MSTDVRSTEPPTETLGVEGETCGSCGAQLATDQRYCLNCGASRTAPRLDFTKHLKPPTSTETAMAGAPATATAGAVAGSPMGMQQVNPITAIFAIALLATMLLLGVLIGKDEDPQTVAAAAPATTTTAPTETGPVETAAKADKGKDKKAGAGAGAGNVEAGGSGDTTGIAAANTGGSPQDVLRGEDVVATGGEQAELDPGPAGGGSDVTCIGC